MVSIDKLRVCEKCGNVFSKKAGTANISECPQCKETSFDIITSETGFEDDGAYLNEEG